MKNLFPHFLLIAFFAIGLTLSSSSAERDFYQIQVFRLKDKAQEVKVDSFLKNAYLPALHRAGIDKVGVFKPIKADSASGIQIYIWVPFKSLNQFDEIQDKLENDKQYLTDGSAFTKAPFNQAPFLRKESILLKAFQDAPHFVIPSYSTPRSERIYELRSYESPTEYLFRQKVKMFNEGGEILIFKKLGFNVVFNAEVISGSTMPNLMYMSTFENMASHDEHWKTFGNHPDWKKLSGLEEYKNTVSKSVIILLRPTDYSDF